MRNVFVLAAALFLPMTSSAQEYDAQMHSDAMSAAGQAAVMQDMRNARNDAGRLRRSDQRLSPSAIATCRGKSRAARNMGRDHPKVKRLYALCARAGY